MSMQMSKTANKSELQGIVSKAWSKFELPEGTIKIDTYPEFQNMVKIWAEGTLEDTLIIIGSPGIAKSETATRALDKYVKISKNHLGYCHIKGKATPFGVYSRLFDYMDQPVCLDDVDSLLQNRDVTGILNGLLETRTPKLVQWTTMKTMNDQSVLPASFKTKSRTMILANRLDSVSKNFASVLDRSTTIWFAPTPEEIHRYTGTWFKGPKAVYKFIGENLPLVPFPSCRYYVKADKWFKARLDWKRLILNAMRPSDSIETLVKALLVDETLKTDKDRIAVWTERTGRTMNTFYAYKKVVLQAAGQRSSRGKSISEAMKRHHRQRKAA